MVATKYTVASATKLLGAKPPVRREAEDVWFARMGAATDGPGKKLTLQTDLPKMEKTRRVRFGDVGEGVTDASVVEGGDDEGGDVEKEGYDGDALEVGLGLLARVVTQPGDKAVKAMKQSVSTSHTNTNNITEPHTTSPSPNSPVDTSPSPFTSAAAAAAVADARSDASNASPASSKRTKRSEDIYFSPIDVTRSRVEFGSPMTSPSLLQHGFDDRYDDLFRPKPLTSQLHGKDHGDRPATSAEKTTISTQQLDQLVIAIANAPLMQTHVRNQQWLEDDDASLISLRTALAETLPSGEPSLTTGSSSSTTPSNNSPAKEHFTTRQPPPSTSQYLPTSPFTLALPPNAHQEDKQPLGGIALTDPKVHGGPIRFITPDYRKGANVLQVGACTFLNVPYGTTTDCLLRVEPPVAAANPSSSASSAPQRCRVTVQVMNQVLDRRSGKKVYLLVAEVDVTESVTRAALVEFAAHAGLQLSKIEIATANPLSKPGEQVDWTRVAVAESQETLHRLRKSIDLVDAAGCFFSTLRAETCTMQTLTLLSTLQRIKSQHQDFLIIRAGESKFENGRPGSLCVKWLSQHLSRRLQVEDQKARFRAFREDLVAAVARPFVERREFAVHVPWPGRLDLVRVRCVPLIEGVGGATAAVVCFIGDGFDV